MPVTLKCISEWKNEQSRESCLGNVNGTVVCILRNILKLKRKLVSGREEMPIVIQKAF